MLLAVNNLPANAGDIRDAGSIPGWEDPLIAVEQLSLCATPSEPVLWSLEAVTTEALEH